MKLAIQYLNNSKGKVQAVQLPLSEWNKILNMLKKYQQELKVKSDLTEAFAEVGKMRKGEIKKQTLSDFLDEL